MARSSVLQSKWIVGTRPDQAISRVAKLALAQRLTVLQMFLRLAAKRADKDVEYVHQLRVSTRRAHAALKMFGTLLPPRRTARLRRQLKRLRRAAGDARDLDVLAERISRRAETSSDSRLCGILERIHDARVETQRGLVLARKRLKRADFESSAQHLLKRVHWRGSLPDPAFRDVAPQWLRTSVDDFLRAAGADLSDPARLHEMRLAGKKLRYAMELLAGVFEPAFKKRLYLTIEEIQNRLGRVNDHVTAATLFETWANEPAATDSLVLARLAEEERGFAEATRRQFQLWWTPRRIDDLRREFDRVSVLPSGEHSAPVAVTNRGIA